MAISEQGMPVDKKKKGKGRLAAGQHGGPTSIAISESGVHRAAAPATRKGRKSGSIVACDRR
jgi:hypothetical protein